MKQIDAALAAERDRAMERAICGGYRPRQGGTLRLEDIAPRPWWTLPIIDINAPPAV